MSNTLSLNRIFDLEEPLALDPDPEPEADFLESLDELADPDPDPDPEAEAEPDDTPFPLDPPFPLLDPPFPLLAPLPDPPLPLLPDPPFPLPDPPFPEAEAEPEPPFPLLPDPPLPEAEAELLAPTAKRLFIYCLLFSPSTRRSCPATKKIRVIKRSDLNALVDDIMID